MIDDLTGFYEYYSKCIADGQRRGQALMNALSAFDYDTYENIEGTDADCFYNDKLIPKFREAVFGGDQ